MKKIWAIFLCLLILSGCSNGKEGLSPSPEKPSASASPSASPASEPKKLVFAEDDSTSAIYHIRITREQARQSTKENKLSLKPNDYGYSEDFEFMSDGGFMTIDGILVRFDDETDLLCQVIIFPVKEAELYSSYSTQKGLKIGDTVETLIKLYGEPPLKRLILTISTIRLQPITIRCRLIWMIIVMK